MTLLLTRVDVSELLDMKQAIRLVESTFKEFARDEITMPQRLLMSLDRSQGLFGLMPAYIPGARAFGYKSVTAFRENQELHHLPTIFGIVSLLDDETGKPLAMMDGDYLTGMRTGAASAVATKYLTRPDASILGVLGSGVQALFQIWAICEVCEIDEIRIFSPNLQARKETFMERVQSLVNSTIIVTNDAQSTVEGSDIVVLATSAQSPVIDYAWLAPGTHINAVGSHSPDARELDTRTVCSARIICDSVQACLAEAGDLIIPIAEGKLSQEAITTSLGEVVSGFKKGRTDNEEVTIFKSVGLAFQDISVARHVYEQAVLRSRGVLFDFFASPDVI